VLSKISVTPPPEAAIRCEGSQQFWL